EAGVVRERVEHARQGMPLVGLRLPVAADDERGRRTEAPDDVLQRLDRDLGAMEVLEDQDDGLAAGDSCQRAREELEYLDAILGLLLLHGGRGPRLAADGRTQLDDLRELGKEGNQVRGEVGKVGAFARGARGIAGPEVVLNELVEALVGEGAGLLDEAAVEDANLARLSQVLQLLEQCSLTDAGLAGHARELAVARQGRV